MRYFILLLSIITLQSFASTTPYKGIFWDFNEQINYEGLDYCVGINKSAGHLEYHSILDILNTNPYLYYPDFPVGIIDTGIYQDHEGFHDFLIALNDPNQDFHGTATSGIFALSKVADDIGTHGVVNSLLTYSDTSNNTRLPYETIIRENPNIKVISQSTTLSYCTSYRAQSDANINDDSNWKKQFAINNCHLIEGDEFDDNDRINHILSLYDIRSFFENNSDILFVLSAGNKSIDASKMNGAIHYIIENGVVTFDPLDNVMVVGAIGYDNILHYYSNYGESVDIAAISGVLAPRCVDSNGSYYYKDSNENDYGVFDDKLSNFNITNLCKPNFYFDLEFNGTSASAPINAGISTLLLNMSYNLSPSMVKKYITQKNNDKVATKRFLPNLIWNQQESLIHPVPIADLKVSYDALLTRLEAEVQSDVDGLQNLTQLVSSENDCVSLWNNGTSSRKVIGSDKSYETKFYGDRCLYFRGNSFIIDYDLETKTASKLYYNKYGSNRYREYMTFRHFVNNLKSAKADETWRNGYGVTLNSSGNVGCTIADNCPNGEITTAQQCENMFTALTGVNPSVMNTSANLLSNNVCEFVSIDENKQIVYNSLLDSIEVNNIEMDLVQKLNIAFPNGTTYESCEEPHRFLSQYIPMGAYFATGADMTECAIFTIPDPGKYATGFAYDFNNETWYRFSF